MRNGGIGIIEEGNLKGRKFLLPSEVWVEKGIFLNGSSEYAKACLIHQKFIPDQGCQDCKKNVEEQRKKNEEIGL